MKMGHAARVTRRLIRLETDRRPPKRETPPDSMIVRIAEEATRAFGCRHVSTVRQPIQTSPSHWVFLQSRLVRAANSGSSHTLDEWFDPRDRDTGLKRALSSYLVSSVQK